MAKRDPASSIKGTSLITYAVGNSTTRTVLWSDGGEVLVSQDKPTKEIRKELKGKASDQTDAAALSQAFPVAISGTVMDVVQALEDRYRSLENLEVLRFRQNLACPLTIEPTPAESVGDDRLASCLGALAIDPDVPWIVLDAGTALTINVVRPSDGDEPAIFEGGLIVPGEALALGVLHDGTDQLPALKPWPADREAPLVGRSTEEAIRAGVRHTQLSLASEMIAANADRLGQETRVALTGGGAKALWPRIEVKFDSHQPVLDPLLVNRGLFEAWSISASEPAR